MEESFVIQSSESSVLRRRIDEINKFFDVKVELQGDPKSKHDEGIQWVSIKGKNLKNVTDAKTHIISLCNPELKEHISFPGFPLFIFTAFKERVKLVVQKEFGIVLSLTDDGFMDIHGSNVGVTMAISKIHHLHKMNRDRDTEKAKGEALQFDIYILTEGHGYHDELKTLSNTLKKELLNILGVPIKPVNGETIPKVLKMSPISPCRLSSSSPDTTEPEVISIDDSSQESSIIILDSSGEEIENVSESSDESDGEEAGSSSRIDSDGIGGNLSYMLPPNFVIKEWIKVHYQGTTDPADFVSKSDMLEHFRKHFDLPDHQELANIFFDKLAVRIFPQDPNYRSVRTKKTKSKHSKRRLVCLRRRTVSDGDQNDVTVIGATSATIPPPRKPTPRAMSPPRQQQQSAMMKDWNASRLGVTKTTNNVQPPHNPRLLEEWQTVPPRTQPVSAVQPVPLANPASLQSWLASAPTPKPRTQPKIQRQPNGIMNSLARRVSDMSNEQLLRRARPPPNPNLRHIIIDGSNVAMSHGNHNQFSCRGIALCARFFIERGHKDVTCFVPNYRKGGGGYPPSSDAHILIKLEDLGIVKSTPSRRIGGQNIVCYDDRFIVELAGATNGVIISNDQYRDLMAQDRKWCPIVEQQLLQFTVVGDLFMFPEDPLGRDGPPLEEFLMTPRNGRKSPPQMKVVKVPARARQPPNQRHPTPTNMNQPIHPNPFASLLPNTPPQRQHAPVTSAWIPAGNVPVLMSPDQHRLAYDMAQILPDRERDIHKVITDHPLITNIEQLMNILLINDTGT